MHPGVKNKHLAPGVLQRYLTQTLRLHLWNYEKIHTLHGAFNRTRTVDKMPGKTVTHSHSKPHFFDSSIFPSQWKICVNIRSYSSISLVCTYIGVHLLAGWPHLCDLPRHVASPNRPILSWTELQFKNE